MRNHPDSGLAQALVLGERTLSIRSDRGLVIVLGERRMLPADVVRALIHMQLRLARHGRRCAIVMSAVGGITSALTQREAVPWVTSCDEARAMLGRARPSIERHRYDGGRELRATLRGDLDVVGLRAVAAELDAIATFARPHRRIVFDLAELGFVDAHGLEAVTRAAVRAQLAQTEVRFINARAQVRALAYRLDWHHQLPGLDGALGDRQPRGRDAVIATDLSGTVLYWDQRAHGLYGWTPAEVLGRDITTVTVHPEDEGLARTIMTEVHGSGAWEGRFVVRARDAAAFDVCVRNATIHDGLGAPAGVVGFSAPPSKY